jgi:hypothetical protein
MVTTERLKPQLSPRREISLQQEDQIVTCSSGKAHFVMKKDNQSKTKDFAKQAIELIQEPTFLLKPLEKRLKIFKQLEIFDFDNLFFGLQEHL